LFQASQIALKALMGKGFRVIYSDFPGIFDDRYLPVFGIISGPVANHWFATAQSA
jgi:hypothetical protein